MGNDTVNVRTITLVDITPKTTLIDVIQLVAQRNDISHTKQFVLFHVKDQREVQIKRMSQLRKLFREGCHNVSLAIRRRDHAHTKRSTVFKAKKAFMRLKNIFARETAHRQNNLNFTTTKNVNTVEATLSKCSEDKLNAIDNLLHSETMLMARCYEAEVVGKVELFRRFMKDINDSITAHQGEGTFIDTTTILEENSNTTNLTTNLNEGFMRQDTAVSLATLDQNSGITNISSKLNEGFLRQDAHASLATLDQNSLITNISSKLNEGFVRQDTAVSLATLDQNSHITNICSKLNEAFVRQPVDMSLLNDAVLYTTTTTTLQNTVLDQDITDSIADATDLLNECLVFNESLDMTDSSESAFGDDDDIDDLERNIFDEQLDSRVEEDSSRRTYESELDSKDEDVTDVLDKSFVDRTNAAIESFISIAAMTEDHDEGVSSIGTETLNE